MTIEEMNEINNNGLFLGNYQVVDIIGVGNESYIYKAYDEETKSYYAIKKIYNVGNENYGDLVLNTVETHPNIVNLLKVFDKKILCFEFIDGINVCDYLYEEGYFIQIDEIITMLCNISSALSFCHEHQIIHNDIHSENIIRKSDGEYILLDFGSSKLLNNNATQQALEHLKVFNKKRKEPIQWSRDIGLEFLAPEKWDDREKCSMQTDIYSLGILMFECLTGKVPFVFSRNESYEMARQLLMNAHKYSVPPPIFPLRKNAYEKKYRKKYEKDYPEWLETVILKCLDKKSEKRFSCGKELFDFVYNNTNC